MHNTCRVGIAFLWVAAALFADEQLIQWGTAKANLQIGWEETEHHVKVLDPVSLFVHLRLVPNASPVDVTPSNLRLMYTIRVVYGPSKVPVNLTLEGVNALDPSRIVGAEGVRMDARSVKRDEIPLSTWWDMSRPGEYSVYIWHTQKGSGGLVEVLEAPVFHLLISN